MLFKCVARILQHKGNQTDLEEQKRNNTETNSGFPWLNWSIRFEMKNNMVGDSRTGGGKTICVKTIFTHPQKTFLTQMFCKLLSCHKFMTFSKRMRCFYSKGGSGCWATLWMNSTTQAWKWDFKVLNESSSSTFNARPVLKHSVICFYCVLPHDSLCSFRSDLMHLRCPPIPALSAGLGHDIRSICCSLQMKEGWHYQLALLVFAHGTKMENLSLFWQCFEGFYQQPTKTNTNYHFLGYFFLVFLSFW